MKKYIIGVIITGLVIFSGIAVAQESCPLDDGSMYFTGKTKMMGAGKLFHLYKCPQGHTWWVRAPSYTPPSSGRGQGMTPPPLVPQQHYDRSKRDRLERQRLENELLKLRLEEERRRLREDR